MKTSKLLLLLQAFLSLAACAVEPEITLRVTNTLDQDRENATLLINRAEMERLGQVPEGQLPYLKHLDGSLIPCQADDVDADGRWDELFGLVSLRGGEQSSIVIAFTQAENYPQFTLRTGIHLGAAKEDYKELKQAPRLQGVSYHNYSNNTSASYQMEGPAWENDLVGFRNYLDQRNGMDIFGKKTPEIILSEVGKQGGPSYHEAAEWGMDILKVGRSLGSGGIAYLYEDSLYRVGDNGSASFHNIFEGSQRSRMLLDYRDWELSGVKLDVDHQIDIAAGRHYYEGLVTYRGSNAQLRLAVGIVNMHSDSLHVWELDENYSAILTLDDQAEDGSMLAMAVVVSKVYLAKVASAPDEGPGITQCHYALLSCSEGEAIPYRFYSLWAGEDKRWSSLEEIRSYLQDEARRWTASLSYGTY